VRTSSTAEILERANDSLLLLEAVLEEPGAVLTQLDASQRDTFLGELTVLASRATNVRTWAELLSLADAIYELFETTSALSTLVLPTKVDPAGTHKQRSRPPVHRAASPEIAELRATEIRKQIDHVCALVRVGPPYRKVVEKQRDFTVAVKEALHGGRDSYDYTPQVSSRLMFGYRSKFDQILPPIPSP